jgi:hypothetical protein
MVEVFIRIFAGLEIYPGFSRRQGPLGGRACAEPRSYSRVAVIILVPDVSIEKPAVQVNQEPHRASHEG